MVDYLKITRLSFLVAIFAVEKAWLWSIFPDGDMGGEFGNQYQVILTFWRSTWSIENLLFAIVSGR